MGGGSRGSHRWKCGLVKLVHRTPKEWLPDYDSPDRTKVNCRHPAILIVAGHASFEDFGVLPGSPFDLDAECAHTLEPSATIVAGELQGGVLASLDDGVPEG